MVKPKAVICPLHPPKSQIHGKIDDSAEFFSTCTFMAVVLK